MIHSDVDGEIRPSPSLRNWLAFLLIALALAYSVLVSGAPVAQAHGDDRLHQLVSMLMFGFLGLIYSLSRCFSRSARSSDAGSRLRWLVFLLPSYAFFQAIPLPMWLIGIASPMRAQIARAVGTVIGRPSWVPLSVAPGATFYHGLLFTSCAILFCLVYDLAVVFRSRPWIIIFPIVLIGICEASLGFAQLSTSPDNIAVGTYAIRNHYAGLLEMIVPFAAVYPLAALGKGGFGSRELTHSGLSASFSAAVAILMGVGIVASQSRMAFISSSTSILLIAAMVLRRYQAQKLRRIAITTMVLLILASYFPSTRLILRFSEVDDAGRVEVWRETVSLVRAYPLFGCGLGGFESAFPAFKKSRANVDQDYAHNDYLQYLAELGLVGFVLAVVPCILIAVNAWRLWRSSTGLQWLGLACISSILAIGLHSFVDFNLYVPANLFVFTWVAAIGNQKGD